MSTVTEWEFRRAAQLGSRDRMFWFKREFQAEKGGEDGQYWKDTQARARACVIVLHRISVGLI